MTDLQRATERGRGRIAGLDALRGIAALSVVLFHYTTRYQQTYGHPSPPWLDFNQGFRGVDLFFMISGFVIFMTLDNTRRGLDFVVSRASRLYPTFWASVLLTFAVVGLAGLPGKQVGLRDLALNLTMLPELLHAKAVDGSYWTLEIELFFYAIMLGLFKLGWLARIHVVLLAWLGLRVLTVWLESRGVHVPYLATYVLILKHIPLFGAGLMLYCLHAGRGKAWQNYLMWALCLAVGMATTPDFSFKVALAGTAAMRGISLLQMRWLANPVLVFLGAVSYPLYLLHENIGFVIMRALYAQGAPTVLAIGVALAAVLVLAALVTRRVEQPAMRAIRGWYRQRMQEMAR